MSYENIPIWIREIPDHFKANETCDKAVRDDSFYLRYVPDWFVAQQQIDMWHDDYYDDDSDHWDNDDEDKFFEWYDGYKKRKAQKAKIKEEHLPIVWHPSRYWDWCMSE